MFIKSNSTFEWFFEMRVQHKAKYIKIVRESKKGARITALAPIWPNFSYLFDAFVK